MRYKFRRVNRVLFLVIIPFVLSDCQSNQNNNSTKLQEEYTWDDEISSESRNSTLSYDEKIRLYRASKERDSVLVIDLIDGYDKFDVDEDSWTYERYDLRFEKMNDLLDELLSSKKDGLLIKEKINSNLDSLLRKYRNEVIEDFEEYHGLTGRTFDVLRKRKDSVAYILSKMALEDTLVSEPEKDFAKQTIEVYFGDR